MSINLERAYMLLMVIKEASLHGNTYKAVAAVAAAELKDLSDEADTELKERAKAEAERRATDEAKAQEEAQRQLELETAPKGYLEQQIEEGNRRVPQPRTIPSETVRKI